MEQVQTWIKANKLQASLLGAVVIVLLVIGWYFLYWVKTPSYSLGLIKTAVEKHDLDTFHKHVDLDTLIGGAYDDAANYFLTKEGMNNPFAMGFVNAMKPGVVNEFKAEIDKRVLGEAIDTNPNQKPNQNPADDFTKKMGLRQASFSKIDGIETNGNTATVSIIINDPQVGKDFTLQVGMNQLDDGTWKITRVVNLKDYLAKYEAARKAKVDELNVSIKDKMNGLVKLDTGKPTVESRTVWGWKEVNLIVPYHMKIDSNTNVLSIAFKVTIKDNKDNVLLEKDGMLRQVLESEKEYNQTYKLHLNPFIAKEKAIADAGIDNSKVSLELTSVKTTEGTTKLLTDLPTEPEK